MQQSHPEEDDQKLKHANSHDALLQDCQGEGIGENCRKTNRKIRDDPTLTQVGQGPAKEHPEHITEARGDIPPGSAAFEARLDVVEPMGMETMVYFVVDGVEVCGRVNPAAAGAVGEGMRLVADLNQMHLIDPQSEMVV